MMYCIHRFLTNMFRPAFLRVIHQNNIKLLCFLLGNFPASKFCMPTFRNTLFHLHGQVGLPMKMEQAECSETSAYKI